MAKQIKPVPLGDGSGVRPLNSTFSASALRQQQVAAMDSGGDVVPSVRPGAFLPGALPDNRGTRNAQAAFKRSNQTSRYIAGPIDS